MLTSWRLNQFKSVTEDTNLRIAPLTLFTGANSAGKSTIIQSMLLTAQTMQSPVYSRPVVLNGHMSRLGSFNDLVSGGDDDLEISIGFDLITGSAGAGKLLSKPLFAYRRGETVERISVQFSFTSRPGPNDKEGDELLALQPSLLESTIEVTSTHEGKSQKEAVHIRRTSESVHAKLSRLKLSNSELDSSDVDSLRYDVIKDSRKGQGGLLQQPGLKTDSVGCSLVHFLPHNLSVRYDQVSAEVNSQLATILEPNSYRTYGQRYVKERISDEAADYIVNLLRSCLAQNEEISGHHGLSSVGKQNVDLALDSFARSRDLEDLQKLYRRLPGRDVSFLFTVLGNEREEIARILRGSRGESLALQSTYTHDQVQQGVDLVHQYFARSVKYLGPLRDEPKPVYPLAGSADPADVGFRGEFTAAVFHVFKSSVIQYVSARSFDNDFSLAEPQHASLGVAVQDWLAYMGVGRGLETHDLGKLGHELKIITSDSKLKHDLTQVGVGVSQVLPILVLALLADSGSTLIFEQPELHLHPKVQSRLADFFVSMTRLGKQCIVETHSEYMVNRLRYLAAADLGDSVANSTAIYFVTKQGERSNYRDINLDELGGFDAWPEGFFDESERAASTLLQRSLSKRRSRRELGK